MPNSPLARIDNQNTFEKALLEGINFFLGAGFSILGKDIAGKNLPLGSELITELTEKFSLLKTGNLSLPQISTILKAKHADAFRSFLTERFTVSGYDKGYEQLERFNIDRIFTTNIDNLIQKIYEGSKSHYINDVSRHGPAFSERNAIDLIPLHGSVTNPTSDLTFSIFDITSSFSDDPDKWHSLTRGLQQAPTLFWGFSLDDAGVIQALNPATVKGREHKPKWIILRDSDPASIEYFESLGFQIIIGDTQRILDYLSEIANQTKTSPFLRTTASTNELFPSFVIPPIDTVPVRPILEFYLGAAPTWSDIYSGQIHKTSYFNTIVDSIDAGQNTIVIGIAASGKSTLLMQIASEIKFEGHKLVTSSLTVEKADYILNRLEGQRAIVFVDNFGDDIDAFNKLIGAPNLIIIGFERDYYFEIISHKLKKEKTKLIDITELSQIDLQQIYSRIPATIRKSPFSSPIVQEGTEPSIFELIEGNITYPTISTRFQSVLQQLGEKNIVLQELLIMMAYVHACRVPVSYDMVFAFLRGRVTSYEEVYKRVDDLGLMLVDYGGPMVDEDQDYYVPRSAFLAEAILREVSHKAFRRSFLRFHDQVSSFRISRFDIFKRTAFDAKYAERAFENWEEGVRFYNKANTKDSSPYLLQQCAIYLLHKHRYIESFQMIDQAVTQSAHRIPTIRNTYAVILFQTNIGIQDTDGTVIKTLRQSMQILAECYYDDRRKAYHAVKYGEQALKYYDTYPDEIGLNYLKTALEWLNEEEKDAPYYRDIKKSKKKIIRKLSLIESQL